MGKHSTSDMSQIKQVLEHHKESLMSIAGVVGVGIGETDNGALCLRVLATKSKQELPQIPAKLDGFEVDIQKTGPIKAL
ncbi:hypothetical protein JW960_21730 [candidate division KSB1 bacterium]|nr:hypothetical protein [candidate division KSB1 bacterium]